MLQRFPNGIGEDGFYQKNVAPYFPRCIKRVTAGKVGGSVTHAVANNAESLVFLANTGCITPHMWLSRTPKPMNPDLMAFDLDPSTKDFGVVRDMAAALRDVLQELGLRSYPMTTGSRGLHVSVPLDQTADFDAVREFARDVAHGLADAFPGLVTTAIRKEKRKRKLFIDVMRNGYAQTAVAPYALRALPGAPVATPLDWEEVSSSRLGAQRYNIQNIFRRLQERGDAWQSIWRHPQSLLRSRKILNTWIPGKEWKAA